MSKEELHGIEAGCFGRGEEVLCAVDNAIRPRAEGLEHAQADFWCA